MGKKRRPQQKKKVSKKLKCVSKPRGIPDDIEIDFDDPKNIYDDVEAFHNDDNELILGLDSQLRKKRTVLEHVLDIGGYSSSSSDENEVEDEHTEFDLAECSDTDDKIPDAASSSQPKGDKLETTYKAGIEKSNKKMRKAVLKSVAGTIGKKSGDADSSDDDTDRFGVDSDYFNSISQQITVRTKEKNELVATLTGMVKIKNTDPNVLEYLNTKLTTLRLYLVNMNFYINHVQSGNKAEGHSSLRSIAKIKYHLEDIESINIQLSKELDEDSNSSTEDEEKADKRERKHEKNTVIHTNSRKKRMKI